MKSRLLFTVALAVAVASQSSLPSTAETEVTTLAGSGMTGASDGTNVSATFMLPMGVAYDRVGNVYVADAAAQRIRRIAPDGSVRTIAGSGAADATGAWVPGGYADGPADRARFNRPAAVAVGPDGRVYVADTYNHCIRVVSADGVVSTFAGAPDRPGYRRESRAVVQFSGPVGLAFDRAGNLYVADGGAGGVLVRIAPSGGVDQVAVGEGLQPSGGIAVYDSPAGTTLFVSDLAGIFVRHADGTSTTYRSNFFQSQCIAHKAPTWLPCNRPFSSLREHADIGIPSAIAAIDDHRIVYTDYRSNSIRYADFKTRTGSVIAGYPLSDASGHGGGHDDGPGSRATFNAPMGIAIAPDGALAIGDGGSRRVRIVRRVELRGPLFASDLAATRTLNAPAIALAGDSLLWQGVEWSDSIGARLQRHVNERACERCRNATVVPVVLTPLGAGLSSLAAMPQHRFDAIVLALNVGDASELAGGANDAALPSFPGSTATLVSALRRLNAAAKARGTPLVVVAYPLPAEIDSATMLGLRPLSVDLTPANGFDRLKAAVASAGVTTVDASPEFTAALARVVPARLYAGGDAEFASGGREALATAAARGLLGFKTW